MRQSRSTLSRVRNCVSPKALGAYERGSARSADTVTSLTKQSERVPAFRDRADAVRNKNYVINKLFNYATLLLIPVSGISVNVAARRPHVALTTGAAHTPSSDNRTTCLSIVLNSANRVFVASSCEASAARSTDARTAIPPPCRGATVTATLHETGGPEDRAPAPPAARGKAASRARLPASSGLLGVKT